MDKNVASICLCVVHAQKGGSDLDDPCLKLLHTTPGYTVKFYFHTPQLYCFLNHTENLDAV